jgi:hypothetical protein
MTFSTHFPQYLALNQSQRDVVQAIVSRKLFKSQMQSEIMNVSFVRVLDGAKFRAQVGASLSQ